MFKETLELLELNPQRATQFLDLMWGHNTQVDMSSAADTYESNRKLLNTAIGKRVRICLSLEVLEG